MFKKGTQAVHPVSTSTGLEEAPASVLMAVGGAGGGEGDIIIDMTGGGVAIA